MFFFVMALFFGWMTIFPYTNQDRLKDAVGFDRVYEFRDRLMRLGDSAGGWFVNRRAIMTHF